MKGNEYKLKDDLVDEGGEIIASAGTDFYLSDGYYYSKDDTIIMESKNSTRRLLLHIKGGGSDDREKS